MSSALACVMQEAFAKAYQWQQQQQEQPDQQGEEVSNITAVIDYAAAKSSSNTEQSEATAPTTEQTGASLEQP
jgi:hypothetical protein